MSAQTTAHCLVHHPSLISPVGQGSNRPTCNWDACPATETLVGSTYRFGTSGEPHPSRGTRACAWAQPLFARVSKHRMPIGRDLTASMRLLSLSEDQCCQSQSQQAGRQARSVRGVTFLFWGFLSGQSRSSSLSLKAFYIYPPKLERPSRTLSSREFTYSGFERSDFIFEVPSAEDKQNHEYYWD